MAALAYTGVIMFEFKMNLETGAWVLLEINGRAVLDRRFSNVSLRDGGRLDLAFPPPRPAPPIVSVGARGRPASPKTRPKVRSKVRPKIRAKVKGRRRTA